METILGHVALRTVAGLPPDVVLPDGFIGRPIVGDLVGACNPLWVIFARPQELVPLPWIGLAVEIAVLRHPHDGRLGVVPKVVTLDVEIIAWRVLHWVVEAEDEPPTEVA